MRSFLDFRAQSTELDQPVNLTHCRVGKWHCMSNGLTISASGWRGRTLFTEERAQYLPYSKDLQEKVSIHNRNRFRLPLLRAARTSVLRGRRSNSRLVRSRRLLSGPSYNQGTFGIPTIEIARLQGLAWLPVGCQRGRNAILGLLCRLGCVSGAAGPRTR